MHRATPAVLPTRLGQVTNPTPHTTESTALLTDKYELTMLQASLRDGTADDAADAAEIAPCFVEEEGRRTDAVVLACTHYPLLMDSINKFTPSGVTVIPQDRIVADSLIDYLKRHPDMAQRCSRGGRVKFFTTDSTELFDSLSAIFFRERIRSERIAL